MWIFSVFVGRSPQRANRFARRVDKVAVLWDGVLDRFPEGMVDGLYLPDFQSILAAEERHDAVVMRDCPGCMQKVDDLRP